MNPKYLILLCAGALCLNSCEKDHRNDNAVDPLVYIVNSGVQNANYYDVEETLDYNIYAYSSGFFGRGTDVSLTLDSDAVEAYNATYGSSYTLLGEDCYQIVKDSGTITADGRRATMSVKLNCTKIMALPFMNDYVIPLTLSATESPVNEKLKTIFINPKMLETEVFVKDAGVIESDLSQKDELQFTTYIEFDNKWDTQNVYAYGTEVLNAYNTAHGTQFIPLPDAAFTFTAVQLEVGSKEAVSTIQIDKSKLTTDRFYTLAVQLVSNDKFKVSDDNVALFHISLLPTEDNRSKWSLVSCSSWQTGGEPARMVDGNLTTRWENRWSSNGSGDQGKLPVTTIWDMGEEFYLSGLSIDRRTDSYVTDLRTGYVELSDDGTNWTHAQDFDFGDASNTSVSLVELKELWDIKGRYLKLVITASNRGSNVSIVEFKPLLNKPVN